MLWSVISYYIVVGYDAGIIVYCVIGYDMDVILYVAAGVNVYDIVIYLVYLGLFLELLVMFLMYF